MYLVFQIRKKSKYTCITLANIPCMNLAKCSKLSSDYYAWVASTYIAFSKARFANIGYNQCFVYRFYITCFNCVVAFIQPCCINFAFQHFQTFYWCHIF